jgi:hypothetical protein
MAHVQSSQLRAGHWETGVLGSLAAPGVAHASVSRALSPARGALLGSVLGLGCWALLAIIAWALL